MEFVEKGGEWTRRRVGAEAVNGDVTGREGLGAEVMDEAATGESYEDGGGEA